MSELLGRIAAASRGLELPVDPEALASGVRRRRTARRVRRAVGVTALLSAAAVVVVSRFVAPGVGEPGGLASRPDASRLDGAPSSVAPAGAAPRIIRLSDELELGAPVLVDGGEERELLRGAARFEVDPAAGKRLSIRVADATVVVLGTIFSVEREGERMRVSVDRGRVAVTDAAGRRVELGAGEAGDFLAVRGAASAAALGSADPPPALPMASAPPRDEPGELLRAADEARQAGRAGAAVAPLRRLVQAYPSDARAPAAAFTLGILQLGGAPAAAAEAFATCQRLQPGGPLAEDALAREVEAWARAGDGAQARSRAELYVRRYPASPRAVSVRRLGGLEAE